MIWNFVFGVKPKFTFSVSESELHMNSLSEMEDPSGDANNGGPVGNGNAQVPRYKQMSSAFAFYY
jgi:hypothetical protein